MGLWVPGRARELMRRTTKDRLDPRLPGMTDIGEAEVHPQLSSRKPRGHRVAMWPNESSVRSSTVLDVKRVLRAARARRSAEWH